MRILLIAMITLTLITACSKKTSQPQQQPVAGNQAGNQSGAVVYQPAAPVITKMEASLTPEAAKSPDRVLVQTIFTCSNKSQFTATFKPGSVEVNSGWKNPAVLTQQIVGSGFWYKNAQYDLRGKGRDAVLSVQGRKPLSCSSSRR